jgi:hypothetical protein
MKLSKRSIEEAIEQEYARVERQELTAADRAELNELIDAQREQERLADEAYWEQQMELEDQRRSDH